MNKEEMAMRFFEGSHRQEAVASLSAADHLTVRLYGSVLSDPGWTAMLATTSVSGTIAVVPEVNEDIESGRWPPLFVITRVSHDF